MADFDYRLLKSLTVPAKRASEEYWEVRMSLENALNRWTCLPDEAREKLISQMPEDRRISAVQIVEALTQALKKTREAEKTMDDLSELLIDAVFPGGTSEYCDYLETIDY